jgi:hypothetical protein
MFYFVPLFFIHSFPRELLLLIKSGQDSYCLALGRVKKHIYVGTRRKCDGPKFEKKSLFIILLNNITHKSWKWIGTH